MRILSILRFCAFFRGFLLLTFVRSISESRHQRIWNQHKILRFFDTHKPIMIFFKKKNFWVIIALFAYFKCKCEKNCTFSNILQKVKWFFCQYLSFSVWFLLKFQKKYKIEAPYCSWPSIFHRKIYFYAACFELFCGGHGYLTLHGLFMAFNFPPQNIFLCGLFWVILRRPRLPGNADRLLSPARERSQWEMALFILANRKHHSYSFVKLW